MFTINKTLVVQLEANLETSALEMYKRKYQWIQSKGI